MSREVCGLCWELYIDGQCRCPPTLPRCSNCASLEAQNTELDRKLAELERHGQEPAALMNTWVSETEAVTEPLYKAPRRLTDAEIGEIWFSARIPGLTETAARALIRAAEQRSGAR